MAMTLRSRATRSRLVALVLFLLAPTACGDRAGSSDPPTTLPSSVWSATTDGGRAELTVEIARTDEDRRRGLMGRRDLPEDAGMAFLFEGPTSATFWMKNTLIPLSIAFWDEDGRIVAIRDMQPCDADPCPHYGSPEPFVGAVEANLGWFREHGVEVGDPVGLEPAP